uniref:Uncharacterized protein n=1 Tax=Manihot esculenta TaxID=3983 RepID=A0A2C9W042_MANES
MLLFLKETGSFSLPFTSHLYISNPFQFSPTSTPSRRRRFSHALRLHLCNLISLSTQSRVMAAAEDWRCCLHVAFVFVFLKAGDSHAHAFCFSPEHFEAK